MYRSLKIIGLIALAWLVIAQPVSAAWYDQTYYSRADNSLTNGIRPLQIAVNISNSSGTNNDTTIFTNSGCFSTNCSDVFFTLNNATPLPYWIEYNGTYSRYWVNITANGTVNIYYGKSGINTNSNITTTFPFNDTFNTYSSAALNGQGNWSGDASFTVQSSVFVTGKAVSHTGSVVSIGKTLTTPLKYGTVSVYMRSTDTGNAYTDFDMMENGVVKYRIEMTGGAFYYYNGATDVALPTPTTYVANQWYKVEYTFNTATDRYESIKIDGVEKAAGGVNAGASDIINKIIFFDYGLSGRTNYIDDIHIYAGGSWQTWSSSKTLYSNNVTFDSSLSVPKFQTFYTRFYANNSPPIWFVDGVNQTSSYGASFLDVQALGTKNITASNGTANIIWTYTATSIPFSIVSPTNGSTTSSSSVTLTITEWLRNDSYSYSVSTDDQFINTVSAGTLSCTNELCSTTISLEPSTTYFWKVTNGVSVTTAVSSFSTPSSITTPGRLNITVLDEQNISKRILSYTLQLYGMDGSFLNLSTTTGFVNLTSQNISAQRYLVRVIPISDYASRSVLADSPTNVTMYVPNSSSNTVNIVIFSLNDYTGYFPWTSTVLNIKKNNTIMHSSYFASDSTVITNLIQGDRYAISLTSGNSIKEWGGFSSVQDSAVAITVTDYGFNTTFNSPFNVTIKRGSIILTWNFTQLKNFYSFTYQVYKNNSLDYNTYSTVKYGTISYATNNYSTYISKLSVLHDGIYTNTTQTFDFRSAPPEHFGNIFQPTIGYGNFTLNNEMKYLIGIAVIIIITTIFTIFNASEGAIVVAISALVMYNFGLLPQTNGGNLIYILISILSVLAHLVNREKAS